MSSELKCSICLEFYNSSEKKPRILSCGHSFCESCLIQLENPCCSTCRCDFDPDEPLPLNNDLMSLSENRKEDDGDDEDICRDHNSPKNCECSTHRTMICAVCGMMNHKQCETTFIGVKLSTKKRKFNDEEFKVVHDIHLESVGKITKLTKNDIRLEKNIKKMKDKLRELKEEAIRTKIELEKESERLQNIDLRRAQITELRKKVDASSTVSEFEDNKKLLVNLLEDFKRDFEEYPSPKEDVWTENEISIFIFMSTFFYF